MKERCKVAISAALVAASFLFAATPLQAEGSDEPAATATPIKHLVVLYLENTSFDAYFGIYPKALNPAGAPAFEAEPRTPAVNGLTATLLANNPNQSNPFRIGRLESYTCDQNHAYTPEQQARNGGLMNKYVEYGSGGGPTDARQFCHMNAAGNYDTDLGYFDGNTVTALWNYAQYFSLGDNFFATLSGESTRGHLNLTAGDVYGAVCIPTKTKKDGRVYLDDPAGNPPFCNGPARAQDQAAPGDVIVGSLVDDLDPFWDICSEAEETVALRGRNIGNLLNEAGVTWGWFQGGFADTTCSQSHPKVAYDLATGVDPATDRVQEVDYVPHHNPFQYFRSTSNVRHLPPSSLAMVGKTDQANHLYDLEVFWEAARAGMLPAVSFLKPPAYQNGHPGMSDPLDEQVFVVETLNELQRTKAWREMAVFIAWDDSDGWYDHVMPPIVNRSATDIDFACGAETDGPGARCGYGPRLPFLVISPFAKHNYVSSALADQSSILRFIEDNWLGGARVSAISFDNIASPVDDHFDFDKSDGGRERRLFLDPTSGEVVKVLDPK
ncbi:MAG TPA: alkaline phosphatase family protein [Kiloniellaceae bacterium]|nr:alkaline phosphatase family protein [Kiloniellaceae bacterium]